MFALRLSVSRFSVSVVCLQGFIPSLYYITRLLLDSYRFKREVLPPLLTPETLETLKRFTFCIVYHSTPKGFQPPFSKRTIFFSTFCAMLLA